MKLDVLIFSCENNVYALPVGSVVHVIRALEITSIPESSPILYGVFDLQGIMTPVISSRELFSLPKKDLDPEDVLIILQVYGYQIALLADHVNGVFELEEENLNEVEELFEGIVATHTVKWEDHLAPVLDIQRLIDQETAKYLAQKKREDNVFT